MMRIRKVVGISGEDGGGCKTNVVAFEKKRRRKEEGARAIKGGRKKKKAVEVFLNLQSRKVLRADKLRRQI